MNATSFLVRLAVGCCLVVLTFGFLAFVAAEVIHLSLSDELPYLVVTVGFVGVWCSTTVASWVVYFRRQSSLRAWAPAKPRE